MKRYRGPCQHCGTFVDRTLRSGREKLCIDCAIEKSSAVQRAIAAGTHPSIVKRDAHVTEFTRQLEARQGPLFEKWRAGMLKAALGENYTDVI